MSFSIKMMTDNGHVSKLLFACFALIPSLGTLFSTNTDKKRERKRIPNNTSGVFVSVSLCKTASVEMKTRLRKLKTRENKHFLQHFHVFSGLYKKNELYQREYSF